MRLWSGAIGAMLLASASTSACEERTTPAPPPVPRVEATKPRLVVLYFDNNTGEARYEVLKKGIADMLVTDLSRLREIEVVERERLDALIAELELQQSDGFDPNTAQRIGHLAGATHAVTGAMTSVDPELRLDVRLIEVESGKVVMADSVVGRKDRVFALHEKLVEKFLGGLQLQLTPPKSDNRIDDLEVLLEYAEGIQAADRGDVARASERMKHVIAEAPDFTLAKTRYGALLVDLERVRAQRDAAMSDDEDELVRRANTALKSGDGAPAQRLGYRVVLGKFILKKLADLTKENRILRDERLARGLTLMRLYDSNTRALLKELRDRERKGKGRAAFSLPRADRERAIALGLGDNPERIFPASSYRVATSLVQFVLTGHSSSDGPAVHVSPPLAKADPSAEREAFQLLDDTVKSTTGAERLEVLELYGDLSLQRGDREGAVRKWQQILDANPRGPAFERLERKIEDAVGTSVQGKEALAIRARFESALAKCSVPELSETFNPLAIELSAGGNGDPMEVQRLLQRIEEKCGRLGMYGMPIYIQAAAHADAAGDCAWFEEMKARAMEAHPEAAKFIEPFRRNCRR